MNKCFTPSLLQPNVLLLNCVNELCSCFHQQKQILNSKTEKRKYFCAPSEGFSAGHKTRNRKKKYFLHKLTRTTTCKLKHMTLTSSLSRMCKPVKLLFLCKKNCAQVRLNCAAILVSGSMPQLNVWVSCSHKQSNLIQQLVFILNLQVFYFPNTFCLAKSCGVSLTQ